MTRGRGGIAGATRAAVLASFASWGLAARSAVAQSPAASDGAPRVEGRLPERHVCFRGRPVPRCDAFWLTELGLYARAAGTTVHGESLGNPPSSFERRDLGNYLAWEFGGMVNRGERSAAGGTLLLGFGDGGARLGAKGRYRRWLDRSGTAADLSLGVIRADVLQPDGLQQEVGFGVTADASLSASDYAAVTLRTDVVRGGDRTAAAVYGGVRLGSQPAIVGTALIALGYALLFAAFAGGGHT